MDRKCTCSAFLLIAAGLILAGHFPTETNPLLVPVPQLREARQKPGSTFNFKTTLPAWANLTQLEIGQKFIREHIFGYLLGLGLGSLIAAVSTDARRIIISASNTTQVDKAEKRLLINIIHISFWASVDFKSEQGLADFFEVMNLLHSVHGKVGSNAYQKRHLYSKRLIPDPEYYGNPYQLDLDIWNAFENDLLQSQLKKFQRKEVFPPKNGGTDYYLNQFTMLSQLWAFAAYPVISPTHNLLFDATDEQLWAYLHFWSIIGYAIGIEDQYNICMQKDLPSARIYFRDILEEYFIPAFFELDYESKVLMEVGSKAIQRILPFVDVGLSLIRLCEDILQIKCGNLKKILPAEGHIYYIVYKTISEQLFHYDIFHKAVGFIHNGLIQVATLRNFNFNILFLQNFTAGLIELDQDILKTSDVYYNETWSNHVF